MTGFHAPEHIPARKLWLLAVVIGLIPVIAAACGGDPDLLAVENLTEDALNVEITEVPDDQPLEAGESRTAVIPFDTMYETELVEITDDTSARIVITDPTGQVLCEHVATESEPAPRLSVRAEGCAIEAGSS